MLTAAVAAAAATTTTTKMSSAKNMVHAMGLLPQSVSLSITITNYEIRTDPWCHPIHQPRNSPSYLFGTSSVSRYPSRPTCPLYTFNPALSHTSLPPQIPSYNHAIMSTLGTLLYDFSKATDTQLSSFALLCISPPFSKVW